MIWNDHSKDVPEGSHAILGASVNGWSNRETKEELLGIFVSSWQTTIGTICHEYAKDRIRLGAEIKRTDKRNVMFELLRQNVPYYAIDIEFIFPTLMNYVNDAIGYRMRTEQALKYSDYAFGRADAIIFDEKSKLLRIHDLKTGKLPAKLRQLEIYAAFFCLEYNIKPEDILFELRIYQAGDVLVGVPTASDIRPMMSKIVKFNSWANEFKGS